MIEDRISRNTWIESFLLKDKNIEKFSFVTTLFTIFTLPQIMVPGEMVQWSPILTSCSIIDPLLIIVFFPIFTLLLIITPLSIWDP